MNETLCLLHTSRGQLDSANTVQRKLTFIKNKIFLQKTLLSFYEKHKTF